MTKTPAGALVVVRAKDGSGFYWEAKWRVAGEQVKRRVGRAHVEPREAPLEGAEGWQRAYRKRRGRPDLGALTADDAAVRMRALITAHAEQPAQPVQEAPARTFAQVADEWLDERRADVADGQLKPSTAKDYTSMLRRPTDPLKRRGRGRTAHVMRAFEDVRVADITSDDVDAFARKLRAAGLSLKTRKKYEVVVSMILEHAVSRGYVASNAAAARPKPKRKRGRKPALVVYSLETVEAIAREAGGEVGEAIRLAALTGLRQGELLGLRWGDVNWQGPTITVRHRYVAGEGEDVPKSGSARTIPLSDQAGALLDRVSRRNERTRRTDLVFPNDAGEHTDPSTVRRAYAKARDAVIGKAREEGDELPSLTFHGLRHVFGSRCAAAGVPLATLQAWMGHADVTTTMVYVHFMPQADDAARITRAFDGAVSEAAAVKVGL